MLSHPTLRGPTCMVLLLIKTGNILCYSGKLEEIVVTENSYTDMKNESGADFSNFDFKCQQ